MYVVHISPSPGPANALSPFLIFHFSGGEERKLTHDLGAASSQVLAGCVPCLLAVRGLYPPCR